jgi:hypothetical protein
MGSVAAQVLEHAGECQLGVAFASLIAELSFEVEG